MQAAVVLRWSPNTTAQCSMCIRVMSQAVVVCFMLVIVGWWWWRAVDWYHYRSRRSSFCLSARINAHRLTDWLTEWLLLLLLLSGKRREEFASTLTLTDHFSWALSSSCSNLERASALRSIKVVSIMVVGDDWQPPDCLPVLIALLPSPHLCSLTSFVCSFSFTANRR